MDAPVVVPRYTTTGITYNAVTIPPRTTIFFDLLAANKGNGFWNNPNDFAPSRFLKTDGLEEKTKKEKDGHTITQYPFLPFSTGKRMCPAFKLTEYIFKSFIATTIRNFDLDYRGVVDDESILGVTPITTDHSSSMTRLTTPLNTYS